MSCPKGQIKRKSYKTKTGKKVKSKCIKDRGKPGKGPYTLPKIKDKGFLTKFGYRLKKKAVERRKALDKAINKKGGLSVIRHLNLIRNYSKWDKVNYNKYTRDLKYVREQYKKLKK